ncbi:MAG TPA: hypothetical protein VHX88_03165 [Solirubrobacteraceae bacterium]|nr:hypothetical protein [Solirubrobacteraceae bacterium]
MARPEQPPQEQMAGTGEAGRGRSKRRGRALKVLVAGGVVAFVAKPSVRNRVLDVLFGPEEQFDYESPTEPVAPDLRSEESQAGLPAETGTGWPPPASEHPAAGGEAEEVEPGAWRFSQHTEWTAESSAAFGATAAPEEETSEHSEVDEGFGREGSVGGDSAPESHEPPPYQAGPSSEAPSSYEPAGYHGTGSDPEPVGYGGTGSDPDPAGYGGTGSDHEPPGYGGTGSDPDPPGYGGTGSDHEPPGYGGTESDHEPPGYGGTEPDPEPHSSWPPPAAGDPHDSDAAPASEPPAFAPPPEGDGPAIGEATPRGEADAPRGGWWLSRLRKDGDPAPPEPPRWD